MVDYVLQHFYPELKIVESRPLGEGLINQTFYVKLFSGEEIVVQQINQQVFKEPEVIFENTSVILTEVFSSEYHFQPIKAIGGKPFHIADDGSYWRVYPYLAGYKVLTLPFENADISRAVKAFSTFLLSLRNVSFSKILPAIPDFHNGVVRWSNHKSVLERRLPLNTEESLVQGFLESNHSLLALFEASDVPVRVIHGDCKIGNFLLAEDPANDQVIDWDTIMTGSWLIDFGDLVRTTCSAIDESDTEWQSARFLKDRLELILRNWRVCMDEYATLWEQANWLNGVRYIVLEQCLRFFTDHLQGDTYYQVKYRGENLIRALNQMQLFNSLEQMDIGLEE